MRTYLLAGAAAVALNALAMTPAMAAPVANPIVLSGYVDVAYQYDQLRSNGFSTNGNLWNVNGAVIAPIQDHWFVQGNASYTGLDFSGANVNVGQGAASADWVDSWGRLGGTVSYSELSVDATGESLRFDSWSYGAFVDWYAAPQFTLSARGGGLSGDLHVVGASRDYSSAYYLGAQVKGYVTPDIDLHANVDYATADVHPLNFNGTGVGVGGEWRVVPRWPLVLTADYNYAEVRISGLNASVNQNAFGVGVKYYFGAGMAPTLVDHQRSGPEEWSTSPIVGTGFTF
jgi:hypothetical protein